MAKNKHLVSVVIPARNEAAGLDSILPEVRRLMPTAELIVVDDGSTDETAAIVRAHAATVIRHPYAMGNGAAIKTGARAATGEIIVFMDGDGQHQPKDIPQLLERLQTGFDMVVGARSSGTQANRRRALANEMFNRFAGWMVKHRIDDLTSGFRAVRARKFREFLYLLPNGFSYPTTITMSFFRAGYSVSYMPIQAQERKGVSHIRPLRDGMRFLIIILKVGTLFSPQRLFLPIAGASFLAGLLRYAYTYATSGRFTNMSALLFTTAVLIFLIGILAEQISALHYRGINSSNDDQYDRQDP